MSLKDDLSRLHDKVLASLPTDVAAQVIQENKKLFSTLLETKALKAGDPAPDVFFRNKDLTTVYLKDLLKEHHIILSFFRGTWCPYCNLELTELNKINDQIEQKGARLIAVSPELYKFSEPSVKDKKFSVLTDLANKAADEFGLVFDLPPRYREIYKSLNIELNVLNADNNWTLPMPATFIISKDGMIKTTYINADYTKRMEPADIIENLSLLAP